MAYEKRWYSEEAVFSFIDFYKKGSGTSTGIGMPTGTGKSFVIGRIIYEMFEKWPSSRVMMLVDDERLVSQNAQKLVEIWPYAPLGGFCAGLNVRDTSHPIIYGTVQSVYSENKKWEKLGYEFTPFGRRDVLIIDEVHMLSPNSETMYQKVISSLKKINPNLIILGLSATLYRMKHGLLTEGGLIDSFCFNITDYQSFNRLVKEGYLSSLIGKSTHTRIDLSNVSKTGGEYNQKELEKASDIEELTYAAIQELIQFSQNRISWLLFGSSINHVEHITEALQYYGINATCVHSKLSKEVNRDRIADFKNFKYQAIVNRNMLTKGFDHPAIDLIGDLAGTESTNRHVQKDGRGTRPSRETGKQNCLVLDYVGNHERLGPINDPKIPGTPTGCGGDAPIKICPNCGTYLHPSVRICDFCGQVFTFSTTLFETASDAVPMKTDDLIIEYFKIDGIVYDKHHKEGSKPVMMVRYYCGVHSFKEFICFEHSGFAKRKAHEWWRQRTTNVIPFSTNEALNRTNELRKPNLIKMNMNGKYPEILGVEWR